MRGLLDSKISWKGTRHANGCVAPDTGMQGCRTYTSSMINIPMTHTVLLGQEEEAFLAGKRARPAQTKSRLVGRDIVGASVYGQY